MLKPKWKFSPKSSQYPLIQITIANYSALTHLSSEITSGHEVVSSWINDRQICIESRDNDVVNNVLDFYIEYVRFQESQEASPDKVPKITISDDTGQSPQTTSPNPKGDTDKKTKEPGDARLPSELNLQQLIWENSMPDDAPPQQITQLASQKTSDNRESPLIWNLGVLEGGTDVVIYLMPLYNTTKEKMSTRSHSSSTLVKPWKRLFIVRKALIGTGRTISHVQTNKFVSNPFFRSEVDSDFLLQAPSPFVETFPAGVNHGKIKSWLQEAESHTESHDPFEPLPMSSDPSLAFTAENPIDDTQVFVKKDLPLSKKAFKKNRDKSEGSKANILDDPQTGNSVMANTQDEKSTIERTKGKKEVLSNVLGDNADLIGFINSSQSNLTKSTPNTASDLQSQLAKNALLTNDSYTTFSAKSSALKPESFFNSKSVVPSIEKSLSPPPLKPPYVPPPSSTVNSGSFDIVQSFVKPNWSTQNPNSVVICNTSRGDLIDLSNLKSNTVAGRSPNQDTWTKTPSQKNIMRNVGVLEKPTAIWQERMHSVSKPETQIMRSTRSQKHDTLTTGKSHSVSEYEEIAIRLLEIARNAPGFISIKVELGQYLINSDTLPSLYRKKGHFHLGEWDSIFQMQGREKVEILFADILTRRSSDITFVSELKQRSGHRMFAEHPSKAKVTYQFVCTSRSGGQDVTVEVNKNRSYKILSSGIEIGAIQWHFPQQFWDARLTVNASELAKEYEAAARDIADNLCITFFGQHSFKVNTEIYHDELCIKYARVHREYEFQCVADPDLSCCFTEVRDLGESEEPGRYVGLSTEPEALAKEDRLWWQVSLHSKAAAVDLGRSQEMAGEEQAGWLPTTLINNGVIRRLFALTTEVVTRIDRVGQGNTNSEAILASKMSQQAKASKVASEEVGSFW
ncbi:MAG: hypothetical protein Q9214_003577 [Letrouitia sp. 1 TL-2023]